MGLNLPFRIQRHAGREPHKNSADLQIFQTCGEQRSILHYALATIGLIAFICLFIASRAIFNQLN